MDNKSQLANMLKATVRVLFIGTLISTFLTGCSMSTNPVNPKKFVLDETEAQARLLESTDLPYPGSSRDDEFDPEFQFGVNVCSNKGEFGIALDAQTLALRNWNITKDWNDYQPVYVSEVILKFNGATIPTEIVRNLRFCVENDEPNGLIIGDASEIFSGVSENSLFYTSKNSHYKKYGCIVADGAHLIHVWILDTTSSDQLNSRELLTTAISKIYN